MAMGKGIGFAYARVHYKCSQQLISVKPAIYGTHCSGAHNLWAF